MNDSQIPRLPAYPREDGPGLRAWCDHCRRWHLHGDSYGHRAAHCVGVTPYSRTGYFLVPPAEESAT